LFVASLLAADLSRASQPFEASNSLHTVEAVRPQRYLRRGHRPHPPGPGVETGCPTVRGVWLIRSGFCWRGRNVPLPFECGVVGAVFRHALQSSKARQPVSGPRRLGSRWSSTRSWLRSAAGTGHCSGITGLVRDGYGRVPHEDKKKLMGAEVRERAYLVKLRVPSMVDRTPARWR
jgi:hypothetical protein